MRLSSFLFGLVVQCVLAAAIPAAADDLNPPQWRGSEGTTFQQWEFLTSSQTPAPDLLFNPYGTPEARVYPGVGLDWLPEWGGREGVWPLSGKIRIDIPNRPEPLPYKDIWVQITWAAELPGKEPVVRELLSGLFGTLMHEVQLEPTGEPPPASDYWYHSTYLIHLEPNPSREALKISGAIFVDEIVVDTICAPEPGTIGLLALGGLTLLRRRP